MKKWRVHLPLHVRHHRKLQGIYADMLHKQLMRIHNSRDAAARSAAPFRELANRF